MSPQNPAPDASPSSDALSTHAVWRGDDESPGDDSLIEEVPVALVYNGIAHAVMMATPIDLEDFALGFSLSEGIAASSANLYDVEVRRVEEGIELRIELAAADFAALKSRRRQLAGRTGCGLCGVESLAQVARPLPALPFTQKLESAALQTALMHLQDAQPLTAATGAAHAAAWLRPDGTLAAVFEDVGRHVALDKLIGWRARVGAEPGAALVTSRASYEMAHKAASAGIEILAAVSAPTALAVRLAASLNLTLAGFVRPGRANVYSHPERLILAR
ncbi:formate dehydrogenase accessory sulfurtransferase FdhD [Crenobacter cavernae]|uniref:Sulfur carrier protein FdhD n=1 Tax=Crenobacter cavernae TaxID=2290923 RepID=A0ABY0FF71_9NEIS|nr:formate dehydrogenase accessory sulfurtransferase FdhD [Crenobacter cavernae]RXZ43397.1 formate dehydrogenase accessory sulfurtransferase FdhD [Crenobacter cavernae]